MTAEIITMSQVRTERQSDGDPPAPTSREMLIGLVLYQNDVTTRETAENWADWIEREVSCRGFKVVPVMQ